MKEGLLNVVLGMCNNEEVKDCYVFGNRMIMIKFEVFYFILGQFTRNYTQTTKRGLLTTNKG